MITSTQQGGCRPATGRSGALVGICLGRRGTSPAVVSPPPPARTATAKPPPIDDQNYGESAGVVAAMSRRGLVWMAGGCAVRRRPENRGGAGVGAGRGERVKRWERRDC